MQASFLPLFGRILWWLFLVTEVVGLREHTGQLNETLKPKEGTSRASTLATWASSSNFIKGWKSVFSLPTLLWIEILLNMLSEDFISGKP